MKKLILSLQLLACSGLVAQEIAAVKSSQKMKPETCSTVSTTDSCPCAMRGDEPVSGMPMNCGAPAAYNYPANINLDAGWDVYGDASYLFWYTKQEGLDLASTGRIFDGYVWLPSTQNGTTIYQDSKYSSGFKVGVGANLYVDDWVVDLEYTYLRQATQTVSGLASGPVPSGQTAAFNLAGWFCSSAYGEGFTATQFNSKWKFGLDRLDLMVKRPYYQGRRLSIEPSAGLRASWIRQQLNLFTPSAFMDQFGSTPNATSSNNSNSWAIGPRTVVDTHWLIGKGFRIQGNVGGSLLFTQFTKIAHRESPIHSDGSSIGAVGVRVSNYNCLRPMVEANFGFGWGRYLYQKKYHVDFSATYDFNYLWAQNMMRDIVAINTPTAGAIGYAGDLLLHGLDFKARFDF